MPSLFCSLIICSSGVLGPLDSKTTLWVPKTQQAADDQNMCTASRKSLGTSLWVQGFLECFYAPGFKLMMSALKQPKKTTTTQILGVEVWLMSQNSHFLPQNERLEPKKSRSWEGKSCWQTLSNLHFWSSTSSFFQGVSYKVKSQETAASSIRMVPRLGLNLGDFCFGAPNLQRRPCFPTRLAVNVQRSLPFCAEKKKGLQVLSVFRKIWWKSNLRWWCNMKERNSFFLAGAWWWAMT